MRRSTSAAAGSASTRTCIQRRLVGTVESLREAGARFRSDIIHGVGGNQIIVEDPSGNPVELFEPNRDEARLTSA